ncbi:hypothetical protein ACTFRD_24945 [Bacillus cereus group sp. MYBK249-1]|nr:MULTISPECIES: hypothetical protein [Bacillus cereus group]MDA2072915.1 hypothetical protein [Bacillus cereus]
MQNCKSAILEIGLPSVVIALQMVFIFNIFLKRLKEFSLCI